MDYSNGIQVREPHVKHLAHSEADKRFTSYNYFIFAFFLTVMKNARCYTHYDYKQHTLSQNIAKRKSTMAVATCR